MDVKPVRRVWRGVRFDSQLESDWCATFEAWGMEYEYHPGSICLADGTLYEPDFWLKQGNDDIVFEVKGPHDDRVEKPRLVAAQTSLKVLVGRGGYIPPGTSVERSGAVWEPSGWVVANRGSRLVFTDEWENDADVCFSADVAYARDLGGIRWFKAVGDAGIA